MKKPYVRFSDEESKTIIKALYEQASKEIWKKI